MGTTEINIFIKSVSPTINNLLGRQKFWTAVVFLFVFSFGLIWGFITPAMNEAPDEASHINMVYFLKTERRIPVFNHESKIIPTQYDPKLLSGAYYSMAYNSPFNYLPFIPFYYSNLEDISKQNVLPIRAVSAFFVALFAVFLFLALKVSRKANFTTALLVSLAVSLIPQIIFSAGYVNIEPLALMFSAMTFYAFSLIYFKKDDRVRNYLFFGVALMSLGLCKANYYILIAFFSLLSLIDIFISKQILFKLKRYLLPFLIFIVGNFWWWLRNLNLYGDPLIINYIKNEIVAKAPDWLLTLTERGETIISIFSNKYFFDFGILGFFANLGGANIFLPKFFYLAFCLLILIPIGILVVSLFRKIKNLDREDWFLIIFFLVSFISLLVFANKNLTDFSPQGRHLFPLMIPLAGVLFFALSKFKNSKILIIYPLFSLISSIFGIYELIKGYYLLGNTYVNIQSPSDIYGKVINDFHWQEFSDWQRLLTLINQNNSSLIVFEVIVSLIFVISFIFLIKILHQIPKKL